MTVTDYIAAPGRSTPTAIFTPCGRLRLILFHRWAPGPTWAWVMLNPSVAGGGETRDNLDPTLRRCMGFSRAGGAGAMSIVNLWPWVATDPAALWAAMDAGEPVRGGEAGLAAILDAALLADVVLCGWGNLSKACARHRVAGRVRIARVLAAIREGGREPMALRVTRSGQPCHPLYLSARLTPQPLDSLLQAQQEPT